MTTILLSVIFLTAILWFLVKLKELREQITDKELPNDETTVLLGLFLSLSHACLEYHRDRGHYPAVVCGAADGLIEMGYLKDDPLAKMAQSIKLFSIIASEDAGYGICLTHATGNIANAILNRIERSGRSLIFVDIVDGKFEPLTPPVSGTNLTLTLPLPLNPPGRNRADTTVA
ncbi:MAG: hypothetical protein HQL52_15570 [Magnetococcales bacterium]|nr:hypothetical protein [Magnetococcales bacterium]